MYVCVFANICYRLTHAHLDETRISLEEIDITLITVHVRGVSCIRIYYIYQDPMKSSRTSIGLAFFLSWRERFFFFLDKQPNEQSSEIENGKMNMTGE